MLWNDRFWGKRGEKKQRSGVEDNRRKRKPKQTEAETFQAFTTCLGANEINKTHLNLPEATVWGCRNGRKDTKGVWQLFPLNVMGCIGP